MKYILAVLQAPWSPTKLPYRGLPCDRGQYGQRGLQHKLHEFVGQSSKECLLILPYSF